VHTDSGKVWKVHEFIVEIFKVLKSLEILEESLKTVMLTLKMQIFITLVITPAFISFLPFHETF